MYTCKNICTCVQTHTSKIKSTFSTMSLGLLTFFYQRITLFYPSKFTTLFYCIRFSFNFIIGQVMRMKEKKKKKLCVTSWNHSSLFQSLQCTTEMLHWRLTRNKQNPPQSKTLTSNSQSAAPLSKQPLAQRSIQTRSEPHTCYNTKTTLGRNTIKKNVSGNHSHEKEAQI